MRAAKDRKGQGDLMKRMKQIIGDACICLISLIATAVFLGEIVYWMMYV
ncbi:MAG: hypothetical protein NC300_09640 [Bacteroidales bacterium]|nr:hypothetical protein [Clostridium sp.]MCM1204393.1 hypothetical protein [Bacteroidales bacterium]